MKRVKTSSEKQPSEFYADKNNGVVTRIESCYDITESVETRKDRKTGEETEVTVYHYTFAFENKLISNRDKLISNLIRLRYSVDDELALLRQKEDKPEEYATYFAYAEAAKKFATEVFA